MDARHHPGTPDTTLAIGPGSEEWQSQPDADGWNFLSCCCECPTGVPLGAFVFTPPPALALCECPTAQPPLQLNHQIYQNSV